MLNLGGIANLTLLVPGQVPRGFDTGQNFDTDGRWIASGCVVPVLPRAWVTSMFRGG